MCSIFITKLTNMNELKQYSNQVGNKKKTLNVDTIILVVSVPSVLVLD